MNNKREVYGNKLETELKRWGVDIDEFKKQASKKKSSAKTVVQKQIQLLRAKQKKVRAVRKAVAKFK